MSNEWTEAAVERLIKLRRAGNSCSECASILNLEFSASWSRNAVIGKLMRLGVSDARSQSLSKGTERAKAKPKAKPVRGRVRTNLRSAQIKATAQYKPGPDGGLALVELGARHCRWPLHDVADGSQQRFCGAGKSRGFYCEVHAEKAHLKTGGAALKASDAQPKAYTGARHLGNAKRWQ